MSIEVLLDATLNHLRQHAGLKEKECDVRIGGRPSPMAGEIFVAVHDGGESNDFGSHLAEIFSVLITVSLKGNRVPYDCNGLLYGKALWNLGETVRPIIAVMHGGNNPLAWELISKASDKLEEVTNGFLLPLRYRGRTPLRQESAAWWEASVTDPSKYSGVVSTLRFDSANRTQDASNIS